MSHVDPESNLDNSLDDELEPLPAWPADDEEPEVAQYAPTVAYDDGAPEPAVDTLPEDERQAVVRALDEEVERTLSAKQKKPKAEAGEKALEDDGASQGWEPEPAEKVTLPRDVQGEKVVEPSADVETLVEPTDVPAQAHEDVAHEQQNDDGAADARSDAEPVAKKDPEDEPTVDLSTIPGAVTWEIRGLLDDDGEFLQKIALMINPPSLVISSDGVDAEVILTPKVARRMEEALSAVTAIYDDSTPLARKKEKKRRSFIELLNAGVDWWFAHKIRGTILVLLGGAILVSIINGFFIMATR